LRNAASVKYKITPKWCSSTQQNGGPTQ
jgi:hypothetical protein